jgi:hypothetical protein
MIIVKEGTPPLPIPWWVGLDITCGNCGAIFQLEVTDQASETNLNNQCSVQTQCPTCLTGVALVKPPS